MLTVHVRKESESTVDKVMGHRARIKNPRDSRAVFRGYATEEQERRSRSGEKGRSGLRPTWEFRPFKV